MEHKFDDNLPIPPRGVSPRPGGLDDVLGGLGIGQSHLVEAPDPAKLDDPEERQRQSNSVSGKVRRFRDKHPNKHFETRVVRDDTYGYGVRIWRKEAKAK